MGQGGPALVAGDRCRADHRSPRSVVRLAIASDRCDAPELVAPAGHSSAGAGGEGPVVVPQPDRRIPFGPTGGGGTAARAGGGSGGPDPAADLRPDRAPADARAGRRLPRRSRARLV